jgi:hypothetical protein
MYNFYKNKMGNKNNNIEKEYLTEFKLGNILKMIYPNNKFINNKQVPESGVRFRPDYRCDELMLIVEFDGYQHYTQYKNIIRDNEKDEIYENMGYTIIRIPYFVQIDSKTISHLFGVNLEYNIEYPHGFIDHKVIYPCDFCYEGLKRFKRDLIKFEYIKDDIIKTIDVLPDFLLNKKYNISSVTIGHSFDYELDHIKFNDIQHNKKIRIISENGVECTIYYNSECLNFNQILLDLIRQINNGDNTLIFDYFESVNIFYNEFMISELINGEYNTLRFTDSIRFFRDEDGKILDIEENVDLCFDTIGPNGLSFEEILDDDKKNKNDFLWDADNDSWISK